MALDNLLSPLSHVSRDKLQEIIPKYFQKQLFQCLVAGLGLLTSFKNGQQPCSTNSAGFFFKLQNYAFYRAVNFSRYLNGQLYETSRSHSNGNKAFNNEAYRLEVFSFLKFKRLEMQTYSKPFVIDTTTGNAYPLEGITSELPIQPFGTISKAALDVMFLFRLVRKFIAILNPPPPPFPPSPL